MQKLEQIKTELGKIASQLENKQLNIVDHADKMNKVLTDKEQERYTRLEEAIYNIKEAIYNIESYCE